MPPCRVRPVGPSSRAPLPRVSPPSPSGDVLRAASAREVGLGSCRGRARRGSPASRSGPASSPPLSPPGGARSGGRPAVTPRSPAADASSPRGGLSVALGRAGAGPFAARGARAPRYPGQMGILNPVRGGGPVSSVNGLPDRLPRDAPGLSLSSFLAPASAGPAGVRSIDPTETKERQGEEGLLLLLLLLSPSEPRPQIRRGDPLNLSILVSGGKETNQDSLSNGE